MRATRFILTILLVAAGAATGRAAVDGPGAVLPLQDRTGDPELAAQVGAILNEELSLGGYAVTDAGLLREALRRHRIRDADITPPAILDSLAEDLDLSWLLSPTLHRADAGDVPQVTISARLYVAGRKTLAWAGFESAAGLDARGVLDLGVVVGFETLGRDVIRALIADLGETDDNRAQARGRLAPDRRGYLREPLTRERLGVVAVIPFDSVTEVDPSGAAATVTSLTLAVLHRRGVPVVAPGGVSQVLRAEGFLWRGTVDAATRSALAESVGADTILTGTVEAFAARGRGTLPDVAVSGQLLDVGSGQILWINGKDRASARAGGAFGAGRVYDPGTAAEDLVECLVAGFLPPTRKRKVAEVTP